MKLARMATEVLPPLAHYYAAAGDLVRRIVVVLHVLDHAARNADRVSAEVGKDVVLRAISFVEQCVLPPARIRLNTELVKKPKDLLEYVIVHEMAHLIEPTHSDRFIELLEKHYPT